MSAGELRPPINERELESIADLIQTVFQSDETTNAHRAMVAMPGFDPASLPTVWDDAGKPLATVQAVPCDVALLDTWLPAGIITMVATAERARGRGYMRTCMNAAHQWMLESGRPVGILYGVPEIYPKFGYRPVMPHSETRYKLPLAHGGGQLRLATAADAATLAELFNAQERTRAGAVKRGAAPWIWESPHGFASVWCLDDAGAVAGYVRVLNTNADSSDVVVIDAACPPGGAGSLLDNVHAFARETGKESISLSLMPDHPVVSEVVRRVTSLEMHGVEQAIIPPQAGMLAILDSEAMLEFLRPAIEARLDGRAMRISAGDDVRVTFNGNSGQELRLPDPADLAPLLAGYPNATDLRRWGRLEAGHAALNLAMQVFPAGWPRWVLAPFWDQ